MDLIYDIFTASNNLSTELGAWPIIKMIFCSTAAINSGLLTGIIVKLQAKMFEMALDKPHYIGGQHHILHRILKGTIDFFYESTTNKTSGS